MFGFFPLILSAFLLGLGFYLLLQVLARKKPANLPRGSMGWPLFGETLGFLKPHSSNSMGSFLQEHCSRYGRVFKSHLFGSPTIVSCDHELNMVVLQNEEKLFKFTLNLMVKHLLSIEPEEPLAFKILEDFLTYMKGFVSLPVYLPGTPYASAVKARARLSATVREIIKERRKEQLGLVKGDFLDAILSKENLSDEKTVSIVLDMLLAGYETTATLMALIVYFLSLYPNVLAHLKQEHNAIRKNKENGESLNWEDYQKMEFTCNVIYESLRCGNVVKFVHRVALQDVKFKGYFIPSGWKILPVLTAVHFDPSLHENPMEFNPWRWTDKATSKKVMPFGGGPRLCPGADLAKVEIAFFLHHLVLNYRWKTMADDSPLAYPYVEFRRGLLLEIEPIQAKAGKIET
ncbi:hypothetical protein V6Z11_D04G069500 [Gossypium hirsutum]